MRQLNENDENCETCVRNVGVKLVSICIVGVLIGYTALQFVQVPASTLLIEQTTAHQTILLQTTNHTKQTIMILRKLETMDEDITIIKETLMALRGELGKEKP